MKRPTLDTLIKELDQARQLALENSNPTAMISATMAKAKLYGLDKGDTIEVTHTIKPTIIELVAQMPNDPVQASQYYKELMQ